MARRFLCLIFVIAATLAFAGCSEDPAKDIRKLSEEEAREMERSMTEEAPSVQTPSSGAPSREAEEAYEAPPEGDLGISPTTPRADSQLKVTGGVDLSDAMVTWYLNGAPLPGFSSTTLDLREAEIRKGEKVYASVFIDGAVLSSAEVTVENAPPRIISARLMPEAFKPGDRIYVDVKTEDADNDNVELSYEWTLNGAPAGTEREIGETPKRGDAFMVRISPYDGVEYGEEEVMVFEAGNLPPMIEEHYEYAFDGLTYIYKTRATDPDGDPLTYTLKSGPDGMEIDSMTGEVRWTVPEDFLGTADYAILAEDGSGGSSEITQSFRLTLEGQ